MAPKSLIFIPLFFLLNLEAMSAACCGGGAGLPNLITGDYQSQLSFVGSNSAVTHTVNNDGKFIKRDKDNEEVKEVFTLKAAYLFSELWQAGFEIPVIKNTHRLLSKEESTTGIGDLKLQVAYEFLPEYSFSRWKPRGFIFFQQNIINAKSVYDSDEELGTDALSTGFNTTNLGISFVKIISQYDFTLTGEIHTSTKRRFKSSNNDTTIKAGNGYSYSLGAGLSPKNGDLRMGTTLYYSYEGSKYFTGDRVHTSGEKEFYQLGLNLGYKVENNSYIFSYSDQSFLGSAKNINVSKSISLSLINYLDL
ncbi:MAG: hypothetical protein ACJAS4_002056 [Bacteriovoracaceae bacterium]|jgi:hypothetical protein